MKTILLVDDEAIYDKMWTLVKQRHSIKRLEESEGRFNQLFNTMKEGVAVYRPIDGGNDFEFVNLNEAGLRFGKKTKGEVMEEGSRMYSQV